MAELNESDSFWFENKQLNSASSRLESCPWSSITNSSQSWIPSYSSKSQVISIYKIMLQPKGRKNDMFCFIKIITIIYNKGCFLNLKKNSPT